LGRCGLLVGWIPRGRGIERHGDWGEQETRGLSPRGSRCAETESLCYRSEGRFKFSGGCTGGVSVLAYLFVGRSDGCTSGNISWPRFSHPTCAIQTALFEKSGYVHSCYLAGFNLYKLAVKHYYSHNKSAVQISRIRFLLQNT